MLKCVTTLVPQRHNQRSCVLAMVRLGFLGYFLMTLHPWLCTLPTLTQPQSPENHLGIMFFLFVLFSSFLYYFMMTQRQWGDVLAPFGVHFEHFSPFLAQILKTMAQILKTMAQVWKKVPRCV